MNELLWDYELPPERIAQAPLADRSASRLLHLNRTSGAIAHRWFRDTLDLLEPGDLLITNDTRVSAIRLYGSRETGGRAEVLLLNSLGENRFRAMFRPAKRIRIDQSLTFPHGLVGHPRSIEPGGLGTIELTGPNWQDVLEAIGLAPLPPYIHQLLADRERYQTVFAHHPGSWAAPTAGLHFTPELLAALDKKGVQRATVTLHVGLDTFRPLTHNPESHQMHGEECSVPSETAEAIERCSGRIIAVGTTTVRTLESFAVGPRRVEPGRKISKIFIRPGYTFQIPDGMFTNFHMPRTTMLLMLSAFANPAFVQEAYAEALKNEYRFLSFGDSMLIL